MMYQVDGSKKTGCFDQTCPGFVQTSSEIALGATIDPMSTNGTHPSDVAVDIEMNIYIFKVQKYDIFIYKAKKVFNSFHPFYLTP